MNRWLFAAFSCLLLIGCHRQQPLSRSADAKPPAEADASTTAAPDAVQLKILDFAGLQRLIAGKRGQVVVVDAWRTSCPPCIKEFPRLVALDRKYAARGLACISLSMDFGGTGKPDDAAPPVLEFLRKQGATFDNVLSAEDPDAMFKKLELGSPPAVLIYDRQGKLRERMEEALTGAGKKPLYDRVEILVQKLLATSPKH